IKHVFSVARQLSNTAKRSEVECKNTTLFADEYALGVRSGELAHDHLALARFLATRLVAFGDNFLVFDKPANLSVWGHARSKSASYSADDNSTESVNPLSIRECLPHLRTVLADEYGIWPSSETPSLPKSLSHCTVLVGHRPTPLENWRPPTELFIVEALPAAYSGLILLSPSKDYTELAQTFYADASRNCFPGSMYQTFLAACWGQPSRQRVENERVPISIYKASDSVSVSYRPTADKISGVAQKRGRLMYKRLSHRIISRSSSGDNGCLVEVKCNSCYAGAPEMYLVHEGCEVIGEVLQASRLVISGGTPMVLPPAMARLGAPLPADLVRALGGGKLQRAMIPTHIHRTELLLPFPLRFGPEHRFSRRVKAPRGRLVNAGGGVPLLSWKSFPVSEKANVLFLSALSPSLPSYFTRTLGKIGLDSTYPYAAPEAISCQ
ncbi:unnamed protein product, partial [Mesocestoides corti]